MEENKKILSKGLEILLFGLFFVLWLILIFDKEDDLKRAFDRLLKTVPVDMKIWDDAGEGVMKNIRGELIPILSYEKYLEEDNLFLPVLRFAMQGEAFPLQQYSVDYWDGNENIAARYSDVVPDYFKESDEGNVEDKKDDPGTMEKTGSGKTYSLKELSDSDFLLENFYIVDSTTRVMKSEMDGEKLLRMDLSADHSKDEPCVLIYHTHGSETYKKENGKESSVIEVGKDLKKELEEKYGISAIHDTAVYDQVNGELDRSAAYNYAGEAVEAALRKYPSIKVVLDLHRDSVEDSIHLSTKINGKETAQIMFFNGVSRKADSGDIDYLYNPNKMANLAFSLQMQLLAAKYYPDYTRKIYIKGYRYNLHLAKRAMLVEVGAQNNTLSEAKNAMKPLAEILYRVLSGEKAYENQD